jgi:hypothetical protein
MSNNPPPLAPGDVGAISPVLPTTTTQSTQSSCSFENMKIDENKVGPCNDDKKEQRIKTTRNDVVGDTVVLAGGPTKRTAEDMQGDDVSSSSSSSHSSHSNVKINNPSTRNRDKKRVKPNNANHPTIDDSTSCKSNETLSAAVPLTTQTSPYQQAQPQPQPQPKPQQPAIVEDITYYPSRGNMTSSSGNPNEAKRWRAHRMAEDYIQLSSQMMMPGIHLAPFGYDATTGQFPVESITALSILISPLRRPTVVEKWSPYEIAVFEAALAVVGKEFHQVQKFVKTKSTKDIIEFYYIWKKTAHYKVWKRQYILPEDDVDSDDD